MTHEWVNNRELELFTDAVVNIGFGAYFGGRWLEAVIQDPPSIAFLEYFPLVVAIKYWSPLLANCTVCFYFHVDNIAVVHTQ